MAGGLNFKIVVHRSIHEIRATTDELRSDDVGDFHQAGDVVSFGFG